MFQKANNVKDAYIYHLGHCFPRSSTFVAGNLDVLVLISLKGTLTVLTAHRSTIEIINKSNIFTSTLFTSAIQFIS